MAPVTIHAAWSPGEIRIAAVVDGVVTDYALWRPGSHDGVGDVMRGRITALVPAMAGAFVALPSAGPNDMARESSDGFLPDSEGAKGLTEGSYVTVKITRGAQGGKGPRLTTSVDAAQDGPARFIRRGPDPLREIAARYPAAKLLIDDPALAVTLRAEAEDRIVLVPRAFDDPIESEIDRLGMTEVLLASGLRLSFTPTPALVAIDVDGGSALARSPRGGNRPDERHLAVNDAGLPELARQIRLRNLSGAILIDFAGMKPKLRNLLGPALSTALSSDPLRPRFLGFTALGLAEIVRPRVRAPLHEMLEGPLAAGLAALRDIARTVRADPGRRLKLRVAPAVDAALMADPLARADLARVTGRALNSRVDTSLPPYGWSIEADNG